MAYEAKMEAIAMRFAGRLADRTKAIRDLAEALAPGQDASMLEPIRIELHSIAGTAPTLGFAEIGQLARQAEDAAVAALRDGPSLRAESIAPVQQNVRRLGLAVPRAVA